MKLTKYGHACVLIEEQDVAILIDPGNYTVLPEDLPKIDAVIISHHHPDHLDNSILARIKAANHKVSVYGNKETIDDIYKPHELDLVIVSDRLETNVGGIDIVLTDSDHAVIYDGVPCRNVTIQIAGFYYHPGDSYHLPEQPVHIVGVPMSGPWSKTSESIDFMKSSDARLFIPIHNGHLNDVGHGSYNNWLKEKVEAKGSDWKFLREGESITE